MAGKVQWHPAQAPGTFFLLGSHHLLATWYLQSYPWPGLCSKTVWGGDQTWHPEERKNLGDVATLLGTPLDRYSGAQGLCPGLSCVSHSLEGPQKQSCLTTSDLEAS